MQYLKWYWKEIFWVVLWLSSFVFFVVSIFIECNNYWTIWSGIAFAVFFVPAVYLGLAPMNLFFTFVDEGTAKVVLFSGAYEKIIFQYKDHAIDSEGNIFYSPGATQPFSFGGLRFYGIPPIHLIKIYEFLHTITDENGNKIKYQGDWFDYVMLKDTLYWFTDEKAEDADNLPLNIKGIIIAKIINPYKVLFAVED